MALASGCASVRITDPPRTATEQFLLSQAAARAVQQLIFDPLRGRRAFLDAQYFAASERDFVIAEMRAKLLLAGVYLVPQREEAEVIIEVRSGGVGIDRADFLLGLPSLVLTAEDAFNIPFATPEIALLKSTEQEGFAAVAYVAYWARTGEVVAASGPYLGRALRDDWWFFGVGPRTVGDIKTVEPTTAEPAEEELGEDQPPGDEGAEWAGSE
jgi:hypothetical protein